MNPNEDLILGYAHAIKPSKRHKLNPENFPSKIGGSPVWLIPDQTPHPSCDQCQSSMSFLFQIYAPLEFDQAYHRMLYVFYCQNPKCNRKMDCLKVFRAQLPESNPFFTSSDCKPTETYITTLSKSSQSPLISELQQEFLIKTEIIDRVEAKNNLFLSEERIKERLLQPTEAQYEDFEDEKLQEGGSKHEKELLEEYSKRQEVFEDLEEYLPLEKIDKDYERYRFMLEINGNQEILRYVRGKESRPLWYSEDNQWEEKNVGRCGMCGGIRVFEFQINSTFLNVSKEFIDLDWGIAAFYCCEKSCSFEGNYGLEAAFVQFSNEELEMEKLKLREPLAEIKEEREKVSQGQDNSKKTKKKKKKEEKELISKELSKLSLKEEEKKTTEEDWE